MVGRGVLLGTACACALHVAAGAHGAGGPQLSLADRSPVVLAGRGFGAAERLVVTVRAPSVRVERVVRTTAAGRFRALIPSLSLTGALRCATGVTIAVRPTRGEPLLWRPRLPDCATPPLEPASTASAAAAPPRLRLVSRRPFVVRGDAFRPGERVVLTALTSIGPKQVVVRATSLGRVGATFTLAAKACGDAFAIRAVGARGSRAVLQLPGTPCVPPPID